MDVTIDRETWHRGYGMRTSYLLGNQDGGMCCLGFVSLKAGLSKEEIKGIATVAHVKPINGIPEPLKFLVDDYLENSDIAEVLMNINDREGLSDEERECQLTEIMAKNDINLTFIN